MEERGDRFTAIEDRFAGYEVSTKQARRSAR